MTDETARRSTPNDSPTEDECWAAFWEIIGQEAYRIWKHETVESRRSGNVPL